MPSNSIDLGTTPSDTDRDIFVAIVVHEHGTEVWATSTLDGARNRLYRYVADWWDREVNAGKMPGDEDWRPLPEDEQDAIDAYFDNETEFDSDPESYLIKQVTLDA